MELAVSAAGVKSTMMLGIKDLTTTHGDNLQETAETMAQEEEMLQETAAQTKMSTLTTCSVEMVKETTSTSATSSAKTEETDHGCFILRNFIFNYYLRFFVTLL